MPVAAGRDTVGHQAMKPYLPRVFVALVSTLVSGGVAWWLMSAEGERSYVVFAGDGELAITPALHELSGTAGDLLPGDLPRAAVTEELAAALFPLRNRAFVYDPFTFVRYRAKLRDRVEWEEHPDGHWYRTTNASGLRQDEELVAGEVDLCVLVAGDSHVDGACNNSESFPHLLGDMLRSDAPSRSVEVVNAAVAGFSFYNYLGTLEKFLPKRPEVFVVVVYGGNDFFGALAPYNSFAGRPRLPRPYQYRASLEAARFVSSTSLAQGLNQVLYFQAYPEEADLALEVALSAIERMRTLCEENDIQLIVAYIPPAFGASWPELDELLERAQASLEISDEDLHCDRLLAERFFDRLRRTGIQPLDLGPIYRATPGRCYWETDLHINPTGHARLAEAVHEQMLTGAATVREEMPDGPWEFRDSEGRLVETGAYRQGLKQGPWTTHYSTGQIHSSGVWIAGKRHGSWSWSYEDGTPKQAGAYERGAREGLWTAWHRNGRLRMTTVWVQGLADGPAREWHRDGTPSGAGAYRDGVRDGLWRRWDETGALIMEAHYAGDQFHGPFRNYYPDGKRKSAGEYREGRAVGDWQFWTPRGEPDLERARKRERTRAVESGADADSEHGTTASSGASRPTSGELEPAD